MLTAEMEEDVFSGIYLIGHMSIWVVTKGVFVVVLGVFVSLASVPRCDTMKTLFSWLTSQEEVTDEHQVMTSQHCHKEILPSKAQAKKGQLKAPGCECELFDYHVVIHDLFPQNTKIGALSFHPMHYSDALLIQFLEIAGLPSIRPPIFA